MLLDFGWDNGDIQVAVIFTARVDTVASRIVRGGGGDNLLGICVFCGVTAESHHFGLLPGHVRETFCRDGDFCRSEWDGGFFWLIGFHG